MARLHEHSTACLIQTDGTINLNGDVSSEETDQLTVKEISAEDLGDSDRNMLFGSAKSCINVVVAGKPSSGKSTALNNVFGLDLEAGITAMSGTSQVIKKTVRVKNGVTINVIDTPGLGAEDIDKKSILNDMARELDGQEYILLYCVSVSPSSTVNNLDKQIMGALQEALGKAIWGKCVFLFTFSDYAILEKTRSEEYVEYLRNCAEAVHMILSKCNAGVKKVMTVLEYPSKEKRQRSSEAIEGIVAVPTCKSTTKSQDILPGILSSEEDWTDVVFDEIFKKSSREQRKSFLKVKYGAAVAGTAAAAAVVGAAAGAGVGTLIGIMGGPIGMVVGLFVGGATGGGVSLITGISLSVVIAIRRWKKKVLKKKQK